MPSRLSAPEALIYVMVMVAAVDRKITDDELSRIGSIVRELPAFAGLPGDWMLTVAQDCGKHLSKPKGLEKVLDMVKATLPARLYETAYVLAAELVATDLKIEAEELRILDLLAGKLSLDKLTCAALEHAVKARHQSD